MRLSTSRRALLLSLLILAVALLLLFLALRPGSPSAPPPHLSATTAARATAPSPGHGDAQATGLPTRTPVAAATPDPFALISRAGLLADVETLASIQPYCGWRNSATQGEAEALDWVSAELEELAYLRAHGLELERQTFEVPVGTELWETRLDLIIGGRQVEVPADGLRGPRDRVDLALHFDSDGRLNDSDPNPIAVSGPVVSIRSVGQIDSLSEMALRGVVVFLDYALIDRVTLGGNEPAIEAAWGVLSKGPAALILVTRFSNEIGKSHGAFVGDVSILNRIESSSFPPVLYVRLEDLAPAGVYEWEDLAQVEEARLVWDADVRSPAPSGNLVAYVPGRDRSRALILGAHIDSPNSPGALDDGSGSAVLLQVARVLDAAAMQPPIDLVLAWFGSEELGLRGSAHFAATHQGLLGRTVAMLQIDCLTYPLEGISAELTLVSLAPEEAENSRPVWSDHLAEAAGSRGLRLLTEQVPYPYSDNSSFDAYSVPNADLIYLDEAAMGATGSLHYAAHIHSPYDTIDLARQVGDILEQMARVALVAALEPPSDLSASAGLP